MTDGPLALYRARIAARELVHDPCQMLAVEKLEALSRALRDYQAGGGTGWKARLGLVRRAEEPPQGLFLYGSVGRGKSMLMDLFVKAQPRDKATRIHFQAFMRDVHAHMHRWRKAGGGDDPIPDLAEDIARRMTVLCLDELEVRDIADAMIVGRLFTAIMDKGVVVVTTSNLPPDQLYKDGLQRDRFLPFIALIKDRLDVLELASPRDYRLDRVAGEPVYLVPPGPEAEQALSALFLRFAAGARHGPEVLDVQGRDLRVERAAGDVARFSFVELCERPLGPLDYMAIATRFEAVIIDGIPQLGPERPDTARRFVTLVDALYDTRTLLACSAAAEPEMLYPEGKGSFEFRRTVSRLREMQSEDYLRATHLGAVIAPEGPREAAAAPLS